jgi:O-antigen biosynthesis protein WbqP
MKRATDLTLAIVAGAVVMVPCVLIALIITIHDRGPAVYWSRRAGRHGRDFWMPKFRSMRMDTPELPTDRLQAPEQWVTPVGGFLRRTSLDELPQLWSVLKGDMSLVGPRPALHSQVDLIAARRAAGVESLRPGITGWAQVNGRDHLSEGEKVALDREYLANAGFVMDLKIMLLTVLRVVRGSGVAH